MYSLEDRCGSGRGYGEPMYSKLFSSVCNQAAEEEKSLRPKWHIPSMLCPLTTEEGFYFSRVLKTDETAVIPARPSYVIVSLHRTSYGCSLSSCCAPPRIVDKAVRNRG